MGIVYPGLDWCLSGPGVTVTPNSGAEWCTTVHCTVSLDSSDTRRAAAWRTKPS